MKKRLGTKSLRVATCQFSVEPSIAHNLKWVLAQIDEAAQAGADVAHFSECALSGYAGVDIPNVGALDFDELRAATQEVLAAPKLRKLWVLLGSTHFLDKKTKPTWGARLRRDGRLRERQVQQ